MKFIGRKRGEVREEELRALCVEIVVWRPVGGRQIRGCWSDQGRKSSSMENKTLDDLRKNMIRQGKAI